MAGFKGRGGCHVRVAQEIQVSNGVKGLVHGELIWASQPRTIENAVAVHHDRIVQTAPHGQSFAAQSIDITHEAKGSSPCDLVYKRTLLKIDADLLARLVNGRVLKVDGEVKAKAIVGV